MRIGFVSIMCLIPVMARDQRHSGYQVDKDLVIGLIVNSKTILTSLILKGALE